MKPKISIVVAVAVASDAPAMLAATTALLCALGSLLDMPIMLGVAV